MTASLAGPGCTTNKPIWIGPKSRRDKSVTACNGVARVRDWHQYELGAVTATVVVVGRDGAFQCHDWRQLALAQSSTSRRVNHNSYLAISLINVSKKQSMNDKGDKGHNGSQARRPMTLGTHHDRRLSTACRARAVTESSQHRIYSLLTTTDSQSTFNCNGPTKRIDQCFNRYSIWTPVSGEHGLPRTE